MGCPAKSTVTIANISNVISVETLQNVVSVDNELCEYLVNTYKDFIANLSEDKTKEYLLDKESQTHKILLFLINSGNVPAIPITVVTSLSQLLEQISSRAIQFRKKNVESWDKIINLIPVDLLSGIYKNVLGHYTVQQNISIEEFSFYAAKFQKAQTLTSKEGDFCRTILLRVLDNDSVLNTIILPNIEYYSQIINNAGDDSRLIKEKIFEKVKSDSLKVNLLEFAVKIGWKIQTPDNKDELGIKSENDGGSTIE